MSQLRNAIGTPPELAISSDACKGLASAIASVFPVSKHRECMRHLMENFKKRYHGDVFTTHMWPAAKAYTIEKCQHHLSEIKKVSPEAITYLEKNHKQLWCRSKFSELSKYEYINNNISESFNSWIKDLKDLHIVDLVDQIRQRLMVTFDKRRIVAAKLQGVILPNVIKQLNAKSRNVGEVSISRGGDKCAEVSGMDSDSNAWRHAVELDRKECTCREWQISGAPCIHAIAFICSLRGAYLEDYVHDYYSLHRFRVAYAGVIRGSRFIHPRRRDHPGGLEKKGSLVVLRRSPKNNTNVRDASSIATKKEHAKLHFPVIQKTPPILDQAPTRGIFTRLFYVAMDWRGNREDLLLFFLHSHRTFVLLCYAVVFYVI